MASHGATCKSRFPRWSQVFGRKIESLHDVIAPGDNIFICLLNGVPLPVGLSQDEAREIAYIHQWAQAQDCKSGRVACLGGLDFMREVVVHLDSATKATQKHHFILYSAHDSTLLPVMGTLGIPLDQHPPYASHVTFELCRDGEEYLVRVRFNGKDMKLPFTDPVVHDRVAAFAPRRSAPAS